MQRHGCGTTVAVSEVSSLHGPKISIVIPTLNQGEFIEETIESILEQNYRPIEILVVDGGSDDATIEILERYAREEELTWISLPGGGVVEAVNEGLSRLTGDFVGIQSSDDLYLPGVFSRIVDAFRAHDDVMLIYGEAEYIDKDSEVCGKSRVGEYSLSAFLSRKAYIVQSSAFFRRRILERLGGWRPEFSYVADNEFWLRICASENVCSIPEVLSRYRYHPGQRDAARETIANQWSEMVRMSSVVKKLPLRDRLAAKAGTYLTRAHYISESNWIRKSWCAYLAVACCPSLLATVDRRDLAIGYRPVRKMLSEFKCLFNRMLNV